MLARFGHEVVDVVGRRAIDPHHGLVDLVGGPEVGGAVAVESVQVLLVELVVLDDCLVGERRRQADVLGRVVQLDEERLHLRRPVLERLLVLGEQLLVLAAQQHVLPFLDLHLELELRAARQVAGVLDLVLHVDGVRELRVEPRDREPGIAGGGDDEDVHEHEERREAGANGQVGEGHGGLPVEVQRTIGFRAPPDHPPEG